MLSEEKVRAILNNIQDPYVNKSFRETEGIQEVKINEEKGHVSLKLAIGKTGSSEQMQLQQELVQKLKDAGVKTVGFRFTELEGYEGEEAATILSSTTTNFITVASGKGGVGKSTVSVNLAVSLACAGKKVGLIDADIYGFSIPDMMGIRSRPSVENEKIIPIERFGVKVISMGFFVEDNAPIVWRGPMLGKMLNSFFTEVNWGELDYLVLDLPPGTGDIALDIHSLLPSCNEILISTPHPTAALVAERAGSMALKTNHQLLGVIENMSYFHNKVSAEKEYIFGKGGGKKLAEVFDIEMLGQIPIAQPEVNPNDFAPSVYKENDEVGKIYARIAKKIIAQTEKSFVHQ